MLVTFRYQRKVIQRVSLLIVLALQVSSAFAELLKPVSPILSQPLINKNIQIQQPKLMIQLAPPKMKITCYDTKTSRSYTKMVAYTTDPRTGKKIPKVQCLSLSSIIPRTKAPARIQFGRAGSSTPPPPQPTRAPTEEPSSGARSDYDDYDYSDYDSGGGGSYSYDYDYGDGGGQPYAPGPPGQEVPSAPQVPKSEGSMLGRAAIGFSQAKIPTGKASGRTTKSSQAFEPGELMVMTQGMNEARKVAQQLKTQNFRAKTRRNLKGLGLVLTVFRVPEGVSVNSAAQQIRQAFPSAAVEPNFRLGILGAADSKTYGIKLIAWRPVANQCVDNRRIGMIDTPIDTSHKALKGARITTSSVVTHGQTLADADHGTAIATLLVGQSTDGKFTGLLPQAELHAVNVFRKRGKRKGKTDTTTEWVVRALDRLMKARVEAINMSLGGPPNRVLDLAIQAVTQRKIAVVAAAGNAGAGGPTSYPAAFPSVIAVTAIDAGQKIFEDASRGKYVDFAAPGVDIWTAKPGGGGAYRSGTSYAVPFVTAAVLAQRALDSGASVKTLKQRLAKGARDLGNKGRDPVYGWGLVQAPTGCSKLAGK